jgi:hypothetical protein
MTARVVHRDGAVRPALKTWEQLLTKLTAVRHDPDKFGPNSRAVGSAIIALQDATWYSAVGTPSPLDERVVRVSSWSEALSVLEDPPGYFRGVLERPTDIVMNARKADPRAGEWWEAARDLFRRAVEVQAPPTDGMDSVREAEVWDHMTWTFERLLEEIIVADRVTCTYFREELQWFAAGYFPCGWEGQWPVGKMRVY